MHSHTHTHTHTYTCTHRREHAYTLGGEGIHRTSLCIITALHTELNLALNKALALASLGTVDTDTVSRTQQEAN